MRHPASALLRHSISPNSSLPYIEHLSNFEPQMLVHISTMLIRRLAIYGQSKAVCQAQHRPHYFRIHTAGRVSIPNHNDMNVALPKRHTPFEGLRRKVEKLSERNGEVVGMPPCFHRLY